MFAPNKVYMLHRRKRSIRLHVLSIDQRCCVLTRTSLRMLDFCRHPLIIVIVCTLAVLFATFLDPTSLSSFGLLSQIINASNPIVVRPRTALITFITSFTRRPHQDRTASPLQSLTVLSQARLLMLLLLAHGVLRVWAGLHCHGQVPLRT